MFRTLDESIRVSPQIGTDAVAEAVAQGVTLIINNRPEGESADQVPGAEIEAAARAAGLDYCAIPVSPGGFTEDQVTAMRAALTAAKGPVLAYCRSGTRSTLLWSLARASLGDDPRDLARKAGAAGYDLGPVAPLLDRLRTGA